jgi:lipopolysaccharide/colanic/teichoic acid biosynthesis glycosyltransferase
MGREYRGKRALDLFLCLVSAPAWIPLGLLCSLAVRMDSKGPILFRQGRVGLNGSSFEILKFRSMVDDPAGNPLFPDRRRYTRVGRILRRLSLDEMPQVLNVLRGDMSVVGPRPTLAYQVERYDKRQIERLAVRPGMTGLAQVNGRNSISWPERIEWDLKYVERQSLWLDLRVIASTLFVVMSARGLSGHPRDDSLAATRQSTK